MIYYCESDRNFLAHHGIKGMRWGHRKSRDRSLTSDGKKKISLKKYKNIRKSKTEEYTKNADYSKYKEYNTKADTLAKKYGLDANNGFNGKPGTPKSIKKKYWEYALKASDEHEKIEKNIDRNVERYMNSTFGKKQIDSLKNLQTTIAGTKFMAAAGAMIAVPVALIAYHKK